LRSSIFVIQLGPTSSSRRLDNDGLDRATHLLGVTPLVTFVNFSGHRAANSGRSCLFMRSECRAATPFI